jgi:hypothetical protein
MDSADLPNVGTFRPISAAISSTSEQLGSRWQSLSRDVDHHRREIHANASRFLSHVGKVAGDQLRRVQESQQRQQLAGMAVSVTGPLVVFHTTYLIYLRANKVVLILQKMSRSECIFY